MPPAVLSASAMRRRRGIRRTIAVLPTLFTLGNLLCGFMAIFIASRPASTQLPYQMSPFMVAAGFIFLGMVMDAFDGRIARMTSSTSDFGEQLDSMADMVTFGVAPAFIAVQLAGIETPFLSEVGDRLFDRTAFVIAMIYVSCAALRLARFNVEISLPTESDHNSFKGMPSPAAAGTVASLVLLHQHFLARSADISLVSGCSILLVFIMLLVAFAMVSKLRYVHPANKYLRRGRANVQTVALMVVTVLMLSIYFWISIAIAFTIYALSAPVIHLMTPTSKRPGAAEPPIELDDALEESGIGLSPTASSPATDPSHVDLSSADLTKKQIG